MLFRRYFKKFDFREFKDFVYELVNAYGMKQIEFFPEHKELFDEIQLTHVAPGGNINNKNGFLWAWQQKEKEVRKVSFDSFRKDRTISITMSVNLDRKFISLDRAKNISPVKIEGALKNNLELIEKRRSKKKFFDLFKKFLRQEIVKIIAKSAGGLILAYLIYKFGWNR